MKSLLNKLMNKYAKTKFVAIIYMVGILITGLLLTGCPARSPAPEDTAPPETIVVPEVARIFFTEVPLEDGPELARILAANNQGGEMAVWFEADNNSWVIVQAAEDSDELLAIDEILQRIPGRDTFLLEVRLNETARDQAEEEESQDGEERQQQDTMLVKIEINQRPQGVAFMFDSQLEAELEEDENGVVQEKAAQPPDTAQQTPPAQQPAQNEQTMIQVQEPKPDQEVTSPIQVLGKARVPNGTINLRLLNGNDEVIAESSTTATATAPQTGTFSGILSFSPPGEETNGTLEVFSNGKDGQAETMVAVPVVIR